MFELTVFITQSIIIIGLLVFIFLLTKQNARQVEKLQIALMSRNAGEYVQAVKTGEQKEPDDTSESEEILLSDADDTAFDRHIQNQNK